MAETQFGSGFQRLQLYVTMSQKSKKIEKDFVLSDSSVNEYGFRLLTSGCDLDEFKKNPIGYYMHDRDLGVVLRWEDLRVDGDKIVGRPNINLSHPKGQQLVDEIENGFLNAASIGRRTVITYTDADSMKLAGQTGPTVTKWYPKECSIVDIPGNKNALVELYDASNNLLDINLFLKNNNKNSPTMKEITLTPEQLAGLNLSAAADGAAIVAAFQKLAAEKQTLTLENTNLKSDNAKLKVDYDKLVGEQSQKEVKALIDTALSAKKISKKLADQLTEDYAGEPLKLKTVLDGIVTPTLITNNLSGGENGEGAADPEKLAKYTKLSWDELDKQDYLADVKQNYPELYKMKYKGKFNKLPKED